MFEGVEGAGKSTHLRLLAERLRRKGIPHCVVREPGGTPAGERIRRVVLDPVLDICAEAELLLMLAARAEFVRRLVRPALARGEVVLADRYELSTFAYQGIARGLGLDTVRRLNAFATGGLEPDAVILLAVEPEAGRRRKRGAADRIEREPDEFFLRVAAAYRELAERVPGIITVDGDLAVPDVQERILQELARRWPETFDLESGYRCE